MEIVLRKCKPYKTAIVVGETLEERKIVLYTDTGWKGRFMVAVKLAFPMNVEPPDEIKLNLEIVKNGNTEVTLADYE